MKAVPGKVDFAPLTHCRFCDSADETFTTWLTGVYDLDRGSDQPFTLLQCRRCGLIQTDPFPTIETISALYSDGVSTDYEFPEAGLIGRLKDAFAAHSVRSILRKAKIAPGRILDFGTGAGRFAAACARVVPSATVVGADFAADPPAGSYYDGHPSRLAYVSYADVSRGGQKFDLIFARHVLEHFHDPRMALTQWLAALAPGGALYVEVPNSDSRTARLLGNRWPLWYVPRHLSHFDRRTLHAVIRAAGGRAEIWRSEIPMMGNVLALKAGKSRFDARFRVPGVLLYPVQLALEMASREGTCLSAVIRS